MISREYSVANEDKTGLYKIVYIKSFRRIQGNIVTKLLPYCNKTVTHSSCKPVKTLLFFFIIMKTSIPSWNAFKPNELTKKEVN